MANSPAAKSPSARAAAAQDRRGAEARPGVIGRRALLISTALLLVTRAAEAYAEGLLPGSGMPWRPFAGEPPDIAKPGPWIFFTPEEGAAIEALVDRLIPPDPETPGGKDCGCAAFIDRQLAGSYGSARGLYMSPPFAQGTPEQGAQAPATPAQLYRHMLGALDAHCRETYAGKSFGQLPDAEKDKLIGAMESGSLLLQGSPTTGFFQILLQDTRYGFFADPIYGGNRDMAAWKMIGFPGARYDYRDWVERHNERYPHPPVAIAGRPEWSRQPS
ncbi:MAG: gluconate 2-dehydrogenase subunit 3 family protein [Alphaproteobacteria bacterium]|nr:gluconate 2-dehydrogenase subunit 3 family protein [Alphaproteobacteria bacterium]